MNPLSFATSLPNPSSRQSKTLTSVRRHHLHFARCSLQLAMIHGELPSSIFYSSGIYTKYLTDSGCSPPSTGSDPIDVILHPKPFDRLMAKRRKKTGKREDTNNVRCGAHDVMDWGVSKVLIASFYSFSMCPL